MVHSTGGPNGPHKLSIEARMRGALATQILAVQ